MDYEIETKYVSKANKIASSAGGTFISAALGVAAISEWAPFVAPFSLLVGLAGGVPATMWGLMEGFSGRHVVDSYDLTDEEINHFVETVKEEYGIMLSPASAKQLLDGVPRGAKGREKLKPAIGQLRFFGTAMQVVGKDPFHVQLAWDGEKFMLMDVSEDPQSMTEFRKRESVSF